MEKIKKIFVAHGLTWLSDENVALSALAEDTTITVTKIKLCNTVIENDQRRGMLWNKHFKLESFISHKTKLAPCLTANANVNFWRAAANSNRSCERYIGRAKNILENKQLADNNRTDERIKNIINLQDVVEKD